MIVICDANSIDRLLICHGISRNYITENVILWDTTSISLFCPASLASQTVMTFDYHLKLNSKDSTTSHSASTARIITNTESHSVIVKLDSVDTDQHLYTCKSSQRAGRYVMPKYNMLPAALNQYGTTGDQFYSHVVLRWDSNVQQYTMDSNAVI